MPAAVPNAELAEAIREAWPRAQAHWSSFLLMGDPIDNPDQESVARIHLGTRQVELNGRQIAGKRLVDCVEAILAHEVGHHVRYPGSLAVDARMRLLERPLLPIEGFSLTNLFTDLMINERLGRSPLREGLVRVYRSFQDDRAGGWRRDPSFAFYLAVYEELWDLEPGELIGRDRRGFERAFPAARADARTLALDLFAMGPNVYTQFLYFLTVVSRYALLDPKKQKSAGSHHGPHNCRGDEPSPDDWADALTPDGRELEAIRRALAEGWLTAEEGEILTGDEALAVRILGLPGQGGDDASMVPEVMAAYYRQQAERYLLRPPPVRTLGDALVPTTLDDWQPGDPVREIDWPATLSARGPELGAALPVRRERVAEDEGPDVPLWQPRIEIYLDVSGSMPDPRTTLNAMTLAAQILIVGALRAGGWARAVLYSSGHVEYWTWCRSETELSRFLMHYIGGGTQFPFDLLAHSMTECADRQPIRAIITDTDFDHNVDHARDARRILADAAGASPVVLLQHRADDERTRQYRAIGARVVRVDQIDDFPRLAVELARALFPEDGHALP